MELEQSSPARTHGGFLMFGESTMSQFTLNLPQQYIPSKIAICLTVVNPYTKYALTMTSVALSIEEALPKKMQSYLVGMLVRTFLVLSTVAVALFFPYFALVMALLGSVFTMLVVGSGEHFTYTSAVDFSTLAS
ncbi:amino acid transporter AVT1C [Zea mays]|uniref:amino acid transporter AVT1C n=1 Tax=Zea mays TaxID=4577 RepID=UPI0009A99488|nr:amino acid transporter AVT1C [Zea mays]|eukprot:XP_020398747.1 amino acid transporter AVT1C [Zea mays]